MLQDSVQLFGDKRIDFTFDKGAAFPEQPQPAQPFVLTAEYNGNAVGLYVFINNAWQAAGSGGTADLSAYLKTADADAKYALQTDLNSYYTKTQSDIKYLTQASADSLYASQSSLTSYLTTSAAQSTYARQDSVVSALSASAEAGVISPISGTSGQAVSLRSFVSGSNITLSLDASGNIVVASAGTSGITKSEADGYYASLSAFNSLSQDIPNTYQQKISVDTAMMGFSANKVSLAADVTAFDIIGSALAQPAAGAIVAMAQTTRPFYWPVNFTGSVASCTSAPTSSASFAVSVAGVQVGTFTFAAGSTSATFSSTFGSEYLVPANAVVTVTAPSTKDSTLAYVSFNLKGNLQQ